MTPYSAYSLQDRGVTEAELSKLFNLSLEDLLKISVDSSSSFEETQLTSSSSVSIITSEEWRRRGDRTLPETISHVTNLMVYPTLWGGHAYQVRGYGATLSVRGSATILDEVPLNTLLLGTTGYYSNSLQLGVLDKVEVVRGPGSALYGSDAFHSVISYTTFSSKENIQRISLENGEHAFRKSSIQYARSHNDDTYFNFAFGSNYQSNQYLENLYTDPIGGNLMSGNYASELDDHSAVVKIFNNQNSSFHYKVSLLQNVQKHNNHPGFGATQNKGDLILGDQNLSSMDMTTNVISLKLVSKYSPTMKFGLDSYFWNLKGLHSNNLTTASGEPNIFNLTRDFEEEKNGLHGSIFTKFTDINTDLAFKIGLDNSSILTNSFESRDVFTGAVLSPNTPNKTFINERKVYKASIESQTNLTERLLLTLGLGGVDYPNFGSQLSPRSTLIFNPTDRSAYKIIYGNAFRTPIVNELTGSPNIVGNPDLNPELLDSLELVYMYYGYDSKIELTAYINKWDDGITIIGVDPTLTDSRTRKYSNSAKNESMGIEFSYEILSSIWRFYQDISYAKSRNLSEKEDYSAYPSWILNSDFSYEISNETSLSVNLELFEDFYLGDRISASNSSLIKKGNLFARTDIRLLRSINTNSKVWLDVKNFFNHKNIHPSIWNSENGIPDMDRQISIGIEYNFDQ